MSKKIKLEVDTYRRLSVRIIVMVLLVIPLAHCFGSLLQYKKFSISELMDIGKIQLVEADQPDSALKIYQEVIARYSPKMNDKEKEYIITALNNSGYILSNHYNLLEEAFKNYDRGRRMCEENPQIQGKLALLGLNMSNLFMRYDELTADTIYEEDAQLILTHAFEDAIKAKKWELAVQIFINITASRFNSEDVARFAASTAQFDTLHIPSETRLLRFARQRAKAIHSIANGNINDALLHFQRQADFIDPLLDVQRYRVQVYADLAECQRLDNNRDLELKYLLKIDSIGLTENIPDLRLSSARNLTEYYSENGDSAKARHWNYRYYTMRDSIYPSGIPALHNHPSIKEEISRIDARKKTENSYSKSISTIGIVFLVLLGIILICEGIILIKRRKFSWQPNSKSESFKNPEAQLSTMTKEANERKYRTSPLQNEEKLHLVEVITRCLSESKEIYSPDFSLGRLAELCNSRPSYISQIINECLNKNFNSILNSYRIREACRQMKEDGVHTYTIESISASVGFKSRSSFIAAFKKETGMTPSEYLKTNIRGNSEGRS